MSDRPGSTRHSARCFPAIFINNYAARLREGRRNVLLRAAAYQFSIRRLDNYFPLPDPFHAVLSKTAGLGDENLPVRARTRAYGQAIGGALLSKIASAVRIIIYACQRGGTKNFNRAAR